MSKMLYVAPLATLLLASCVVVPEHREVVVAPALPVIVELGAEPYYYHSGYHYYYHDDHWSYSHSRAGPWMDLPRHHYPREVRHHGHHDNRKGKHKDDHKDEHRDRHHR